MCFVKSQEPEPIQSPAKLQDTNVQAARSDAQRKARTASGAKSTMLTPARQSGAQSTPSYGKTLLGQ